MNDWNEQDHPRVRRGAAGGRGGEFDDKPAVGDDRDLIPEEFQGDQGEGHTRRLERYHRWLQAHPRVLWMDELLAARTGPYRDEPVITLDEELELKERALKRFMGKLGVWFKNEAECETVSMQLIDDRLMALRRSCVADPEQSYSLALCAHALTSRPVRVESLLAKEPWRISAHRMRVGRRYQNAVAAWKGEHDGASPDEATRDRLWDETMSAFIDEKTARGVSFGRGMYYSDGHTADPRAADPHRLRLDGSGRPFNARIDFERMVGEGLAVLGRPRKDWDVIVNMNPAMADRMRGDDETVHAAFMTALERGLDVERMADALNLDEGTVARWRAERAS